MPQQLAINFDVCANRSRRNTNSAAAHQKVVPAKLDRYRQIYALITVLGARTGKEIAAEMGKPFNTISGRLSEMKHIGLLAENGERRDGAAVLIIAKPNWKGESL